MSLTGRVYLKLYKLRLNWNISVEYYVVIAAYYSSKIYLKSCSSVNGVEMNFGKVTNTWPEFILSGSLVNSKFELRFTSSKSILYSN